MIILSVVKKETKYVWNFVIIFVIMIAYTVGYIYLFEDSPIEGWAAFLVYLFFAFWVYVYTVIGIYGMPKSKSWLDS
jgi:4-hydroxybenzoate polyprenyltransferase